MKISARNQLEGTVVSVTEGAVNGIVAIDLGDAVVKANITKEAIADLGLKSGTSVFALIKASNVMFASGPEPIRAISARNQLAGKIVAVQKGAVNGHVTLQLPRGNKITGSVTNEAIEDLGLSEGIEAQAIIKSTDIMVGVE